ncbi:hypothetical protein TNCV_856811 [Trichonephila clavipes]|nr:hypothetical protein TNCV_856811 [Trichonephila clavipes]
MSLLPSDDLGNGPRMSKAIRSKGTSKLYSCSLLVRFLCPFRAARKSHVPFPRHSAHCSSRSAHELYDQPVDRFGRSHHSTGPMPMLMAL